MANRIELPKTVEPQTIADIPWGKAFVASGYLYIKLSVDMRIALEYA